MTWLVLLEQERRDDGDTGVEIETAAAAADVGAIVVEVAVGAAAAVVVGAAVGAAEQSDDVDNEIQQG